MYSRAALHALAQDPQFVAAVRHVAAELIATDPTLRTHLAALLNYQPAIAGTVLNLLEPLDINYRLIPYHVLGDLLDVWDRVHATATT